MMPGFCKGVVTRFNKCSNEAEELMGMKPDERGFTKPYCSVNELVEMRQRVNINIGELNFIIKQVVRNEKYIDIQDKSKELVEQIGLRLK